jgi:hypothetical protein
MTIEEIREELLNKIHELEWRNTVRSLELINWLQELLKKTEPKQAPIKKEVKVELPEEVEEEVKEEKKAPKRKIVFKKK